MTRTEARLIAEELYKLMRPQIEKIVKEVTQEATDRLIGSKEAAEILGWEVKTLYNRIKEVPHTKVGKKLRFSERTINQFARRS